MITSDAECVVDLRQSVREDSVEDDVLDLDDAARVRTGFVSSDMGVLRRSVG